MGKIKRKQANRKFESLKIMPEEKVKPNCQEMGENTAASRMPSEAEIKKGNELPSTNMEYVPFSDYSNITIPLIGKNVFPNDEKPFNKRYDLAVERNKRRFAYMEKTGETSRLMESISQNDKKKNAMIQKRKNINMACYITELCSKILKELRSDKFRERKIACYLRKFLLAPVTSTCLLYVPHLIHTISFIRGNKNFSDLLRLTANECYDKCHVMFAIPPGCNFETVYTSEMKKFLPDDFEKFEGNQFDYGNVDDILENCDPEVYNKLVTALYNDNQ